MCQAPLGADSDYAFGDVAENRLADRKDGLKIAPLRRNSVLTSRLPMKPVAPVMKYCIVFST